MSDDITTVDLETRGALRTMLEGRTDEEIEQFVEMLGVEQLFEMVIPQMVNRFDADKAAGQTAVVQFEVRDKAGATHAFHVDVENGTCAGATGPAEAPRVTLNFSVPVFLRFLSGLLDPMQAFMSGQLKVTGDMVFAVTFQGWFILD